MNESIESLWKQGFIEEGELDVPKLNNLYDRKSTHIIEKIHDMYKANVKWIKVGLLLQLVVNLSFGWTILATSLVILLGYIIFKGEQSLAKLEALDKGVNSYQYLLSVHQWFADMHETFVRIYSYFYPILFTAIAAEFLRSDLGAQVIEFLSRQYPSIQTVGGIPISILGTLMALTGLLYLAGERIAKWDIRIVYGSISRKIEQLLCEMEELRR